MKKILVLTVAALLACSSAALAAGTATLTVNATVLGTCAFDTTDTTLSFGVIDPAALVGDATATTSIAFTCSNGTQATLTDSSSGNLTGGFSGGSLPYALAYTIPVGTGASQNITIDGTIANADILTAAADVYTEVVTLSINP